MSSSQYLTKEKFEELKQELETLRTETRKKVGQSLEYARALGDLSENAEYQEAREMQANVEDRIAVIENTLKTAQIVDERHMDTIGIGSLVSLKREDGEGDYKVRIVGSEEVNPAEGKISNLSPMGSVLMGKRKGDVVKVSTPKGKISYKVVATE